MDVQVPPGFNDVADLNQSTFSNWRTASSNLANQKTAASFSTNQMVKSQYTSKKDGQKFTNHKAPFNSEMVGEKK